MSYPDAVGDGLRMRMPTERVRCYEAGTRRRREKTTVFDNGSSYILDSQG
jgi:hypothetical protein